MQPGSRENRARRANPADRGKRSDRGNRPDREGRGDRVGRSDRGNRTDREGRGGRVGRSDRGNRTDRERRSGRGEREGRSDRPGRGFRAYRPGRDASGRASAPRGGGRSRYDESERPPRREPERGSRVRDEDIGQTWPELPEWALSEELPPDVRRDLRGLSKDGADFVARHLVAASALADEDPDLAWQHARAARSKGGRIAVVRETVGLVGYRAGQWSEAIAELRAARRMGGGPGHLAVMADSERALGQPQRAIALFRSDEAAELDPDAHIEMLVVVAGARADLGQLDAALVLLEGAGVADADADVRLLYAYADLLAGAGHDAEALGWFIKAHDADIDEETDAADRIAALSAGESDRNGGTTGEGTDRR